ncbi:hypothetical protein OE88DRAFT_468016 [Heliocybe sulcata]|uniref:Uncharacterized protein n=1 Tax=Heliocybe sulcata TaxID=5364 RepID=A0A5C3MY65_9AGAM|nr:hypothetical protein OE88DRAFT_468016 [Heliocybe sulcata]
MSPYTRPTHASSPQIGNMPHRSATVLEPQTMNMPSPSSSSGFPADVREPIVYFPTPPYSGAEQGGSRYGGDAAHCDIDSRRRYTENAGAVFRNQPYGATDPQEYHSYPPQPSGGFYLSPLSPSYNPRSSDTSVPVINGCPHTSYGVNDLQPHNYEGNPASWNATAPYYVPPEPQNNTYLGVTSSPPIHGYGQGDPYNRTSIESRARPTPTVSARPGSSPSSVCCCVIC